jgi:hypothetical protein
MPTLPVVGRSLDVAIALVLTLGRLTRRSLTPGELAASIRARVGVVETLAS